MGYLSLTCITILCFITFSCGSSDKNIKKKEEKDSVKHPANKQQDSIPTPTPQPPGVSPGTIRLTGQVISVHPGKSKKGGVIKLKIDQISGAGPATPDVAKNDTLTVKTSVLPDSIQVGEKITGEIQHHRVLAKFEGTSPQWVLINIKKGTKIRQKNK